LAYQIKQCSDAKAKQEEKEAQEKKATVAKEMEQKMQAEMAITLAPVKIQGDIILGFVKKGFTLLMQPTFDAVAEHLKCNFVVYGSYPAAMMVEEMKNTSKSVNPNPFPKLITMRFDDIDVVYGTFGSGEFERKSYTKLKLALQKEVNFVKAINIPIGENFLNCIDVNMVAICCQIEVIDGKVSGVEVFVHPRFWEFALFNPIVTPIRFATPAQTYIRAAYKAFTHGLQLNLGGLNPCVGEFYQSHRDKVYLPSSRLHSVSCRLGGSDEGLGQVAVLYVQDPANDELSI
jgi:hypothetical protein